MAAEVPVSDVLCEAMEYLSKLGSNLRTRSESLKEKRIRKDKLKNAHAVQKAANKVLLICELSKKSLENVESGIKKILSTVGASQASSRFGGKYSTSKEKRENTNESTNYHYFKYRSHNLRISKKIPLKHYMSVKVLAKMMPETMCNKYPVYYNCKLLRSRQRAKSLGNNHSHKDTDDLMDDEVNKIIENIKSLKADIGPNNLNENVFDDIYKSQQELVSDHTYEKSGEEPLPKSPTEEPFIGYDKTNINIKNKHHLQEHSVLSKSDSVLSKGRSELDIKKNDKEMTKSSEPKKESMYKQLTSDKEIPNKKKYKHIRILDDSSNSQASDIEVLNNVMNESTILLESKSAENKNTTHITLTASLDSDIKDVVKDSEKQESDDDTKKPLIKCVNINKLLKPDIISTKLKPSTIKKSVSFKPEFKTLSKKYKPSTLEYKNIDDEDGYWDKKREEVKSFKAKEFVISVTHLPNLKNPSVTFLNTHKIKSIIHNGVILCSINALKEHDQQNYPKAGESETEKNIVNKHAILKDSDLDNVESEKKLTKELTTEAEMIKNALLNESDSDCSTSEQITKQDHVSKENTKVNENPFEDNDIEARINKPPGEINDRAQSTVLDDSNDRVQSTVLEVSNDQVPNVSSDTSRNNKYDQALTKNPDLIENQSELNNETTPVKNLDDPKQSLLNDSSEEKTLSQRKKRKSSVTPSKRKHIMESMHAKKMLLTYSSSSDTDDEQLRNALKEIKNELLQGSDEENLLKQRVSKPKSSSSISSDEDVFKKVKKKTRKTSILPSDAEDNSETNDTKEKCDNTAKNSDEQSNSSSCKVRC